MDANQLQQIESAVRNPETIVETEQEILDRNRCFDLFINSNLGMTHRSHNYEAGWKAAKAYYQAQQQ